MKRKILWVLGLLLISGSVWAEGICPPGQYPIGDARAPGCAPIPNYQGGGNGSTQIPPPPPPPTGEWIKTWGAIADGNNGRGGVAVGQMSKSAAENEAVRQCARGGGANCKPTFAYENQCVVISTAISGPPNGVVQSAKSIEIAKQMALPKCSSQNSGSACEIVYSACSDPIFRRY